MFDMKEGRMKEGESKIIQRGKKVWVYVPLLVSSDSAFPFRKGDFVKIRIVEDKLIVERLTKEKKEKR